VAEIKKALGFAHEKTESWYPVLDRAVSCTEAALNIRILKMEKDMLTQILMYMLEGIDNVCGPDEIEDLTNAVTGRDMKIFKMEINDCKWKVKALGQSALSNDSKLSDRIVAAAHSLDVPSYYPPVDYDVLAKIYKGLCGQRMPDTYLPGNNSQVHDETVEEDEGTRETSDLTSSCGSVRNTDMNDGKLQATPVGQDVKCRIQISFEIELPRIAEFVELLQSKGMNAKVDIGAPVLATPADTKSYVAKRLGRKSIASLNTFVSKWKRSQGQYPPWVVTKPGLAWTVNTDAFERWLITTEGDKAKVKRKPGRPPKFPR
jgi:hypothetical protein